MGSGIQGSEDAQNPPTHFEHAWDLPVARIITYFGLKVEVHDVGGLDGDVGVDDGPQSGQDLKGDRISSSAVSARWLLLS